MEKQRYIEKTIKERSNRMKHPIAGLVTTAIILLFCMLLKTKPDQGTVTNLIVILTGDRIIYEIRKQGEKRK